MTEPRSPRIFQPDDPALNHTSADDPVESNVIETTAAPASDKHENRTRISATTILVSALCALIVLSLSVSFASFLSAALDRNDWIGWTATSLLIAAALAALVLAVRELAGILRMRRIATVRSLAEEAIKTENRRIERQTTQKLRALLRNKKNLAWARARIRDYERDVQDTGDLLRLAEKELVAPLDQVARQVILKSAKNVAVVSALSPLIWLAMIYVLFENLRMLRKLSEAYGAAPGFVGGLRLARMVVGHIVATGGIAMTDDLLGQFLGQDVLRRLSRRLGEGAFNGALTARIGAAAIHVTRPLPYIETEPARVRDLLPEALAPLTGKFKRQTPGKTPEDGAP